MEIQANPSGTRHIEVSEEHLQTIHRYQLFDSLADSSGIIDETVLEKLKFTVRSLLETAGNNDNNLLDLCLDVLYNKNMKAFGLQQLIDLYGNWMKDEE